MDSGNFGSGFWKVAQGDAISNRADSSAEQKSAVSRLSQDAAQLARERKEKGSEAPASGKRSTNDEIQSAVPIIKQAADPGKGIHSPEKVNGSLRLGEDIYSLKNGILYQQNKEVGKLKDDYLVEFADGRKVSLPHEKMAIMEIMVEGDTSSYKHRIASTGTLQDSQNTKTAPGMVDTNQLLEGALAECVKSNVRQREYEDGKSTMLTFLGINAADETVRHQQRGMHSHVDMLQQNLNLMFDHAFDKKYDTANLALCARNTTETLSAIGIVGDRFEQVAQKAAEINEQTVTAINTGIITAGTAGLGAYIQPLKLAAYKAAGIEIAGSAAIGSASSLITRHSKTSDDLRNVIAGGVEGAGNGFSGFTGRLAKQAKDAGKIGLGAYLAYKGTDALAQSMISNGANAFRIDNPDAFTAKGVIIGTAAQLAGDVIGAGLGAAAGKIAGGAEKRLGAALGDTGVAAQLGEAIGAAESKLGRALQPGSKELATLLQGVNLEQVAKDLAARNTASKIVGFGSESLAHKMLEGVSAGYANGFTSAIPEAIKSERVRIAKELTKTPEQLTSEEYDKGVSWKNIAKYCHESGVITAGIAGVGSLAAGTTTGAVEHLQPKKSAPHVDGLSRAATSSDANESGVKQQRKPEPAETQDAIDGETAKKQQAPVDESTDKRKVTESVDVPVVVGNQHYEAPKHITVEYLSKVFSERPELTSVDLSNCHDLTHLPDNLPVGLTHLDLRNCIRLKQLPDNLPPGLKQLDISTVWELKQLPANLPESLTDLNVSMCPNLQHLPYSLPANLTRLSVIDCHRVKELPKLPDNLKELSLNLNHLKKLPKNLSAALTHLELRCGSLLSLPENLPPNLQVLKLANCDKLVELPRTLPKSLHTLNATHCPQLERVPDVLANGVRPVVDNCPLVTRDSAESIEARAFKKLNGERLASMLKETADALQTNFPPDTNFVFLGRDAWPLVALLRERGMNAQYFLWSRLQSENPKFARQAAEQWMQEVPPNSVVIDTGIRGSIPKLIRGFDPTIKPYLINSTGAIPELPGVTYSRDDLYVTLEQFPKVLGRARRYYRGLAVCHTRDRDSEEIVPSVKTTIGVTKLLLQHAGLSEEAARRYSTFTGLTPKQRLGPRFGMPLQPRELPKEAVHRHRTITDVKPQQKPELPLEKPAPPPPDHDGPVVW